MRLIGRTTAFLLLLMLATTPIHAQAVGTRAPVISVTDLDGGVVTLPANRPALIEFWATWCEVCEQLYPRMVAAHRQFGDRVDFYGVNVTVNESKARVRRWVAERRPPFRTLYDERGVAVRGFALGESRPVAIGEARHFERIARGHLEVEDERGIRFVERGDDARQVEHPGAERDFAEQEAVRARLHGHVFEMHAESERC